MHPTPLEIRGKSAPAWAHDAPAQQQPLQQRGLHSEGVAEVGARAQRWQTPRGIAQNLQEWQVASVRFAQNVSNFWLRQRVVIHILLKSKGTYGFLLKRVVQVMNPILKRSKYDLKV